ncbi:hypothetical protein ABZT06_15950 [Streptomyces sp. NPDC005483]
MTVPDEDRPEPRTGEADTPRAPGGSGRTLREAFEEAGMEPDDLAQE